MNKHLSAAKRFAAAALIIEIVLFALLFFAVACFRHELGSVTFIRTVRDVCVFLWLSLPVIVFVFAIAGLINVKYARLEGAERTTPVKALCIAAIVIMVIGLPVYMVGVSSWM